MSRELRRNVRLHDGGVYDGELAHARARERRQRVRPGRLACDPELARLVQSKLEVEWSPEQIAGWLRMAHPDRPEWHVCHETIYQALYHGGRGGLSRALTAKLRTGRPLRKCRRRAHERTPRFVVVAQLIDERPAAADTRERVGDWEGDLIVGQASRSAIGTLVDRRSRYLALVHLPDGHTAAHLVAGMRATLAGIPDEFRHTLTWDQGSEMASHDQIATFFGEGVYFAHAGKPWQRGTNENTNKLLRQYFPKGANLNIYDLADLIEVAERLNNRPRKTLGWRTPTQAFHSEIP